LHWFTCKFASTHLTTTNWRHSSRMGNLPRLEGAARTLLLCGKFRWAATDTDFDSDELQIFLTCQLSKSALVPRCCANIERCELRRLRQPTSSRGPPDALGSGAPIVPAVPAVTSSSAHHGSHYNNGPGFLSMYLKCCLMGNAHLQQNPGSH
jgi:hypothetical protein